jgi:DNA polymerase-3 subunit beta
MKFSAAREAILKPLQTVVGVVERRQTMPILSNVLLTVRGEKLAITATDLEVEMVAEGDIDGQADGEITVPGRKLHEICRALPDAAKVEMALNGERLTVKAGRSRFTLSTLRATDFPVVEQLAAKQTLRVSKKDLRKLIDKTHFSMAQQDVRYYLNGLLLETERKKLRAVATDGHRLALSEIELEVAVSHDEQLIMPRKGVLELNRLLDGDGSVELALGANHIRAQFDGFRLP